ncbi:hypothetical protein EJ04DRAFT_581819 [Polyplosphaeria fusca]|uniref:RING-type domain-containing protein n=1 Tax=Polyplosphaeria fusca TaxID=682080 RepID=A0A9P4QML2_9PLEO|nr:hypothetical protein EJ04DRAFT_581819 [Polyplosphaeria fusca]
MTSVFSSLVRRPSSTTSISPASHAPENEQPNLAELNAALQALTDIFPDIQPDVFREMLTSFSDESRLQVITETLLKHSAKWVRGRYRMPAEQEEQKETMHKYKYRTVNDTKDTRGAPLALEDTFRSNAYKEAAKEALYNEFKGLSHSTIKAVLAEYNWSYMAARPTLLVLASKSWRSSITNFFMRRKPPNAQSHPLVLWSSGDVKTGRPRTPMLVKTKSKELDAELHAALISPELEKQRRETEASDQVMARELNEREAEEADEMYDCECCFVPNTLQQLSTCDVEGHYLCFTCIRHAVNAALYDQGWARTINAELCTLRCIAPSSTSTACAGCVPLVFVQSALGDEDADTFAKFNERLSSEQLVKTNLPLVRCPFCPYAEVDDLALPVYTLLTSLRLRKRPLFVASISLLELLTFGIFRLIFSLIILALSIFALLHHLLPRLNKPRSFLLRPLENALRRIHLKRRGLRFTCQSAQCGRASCLSCAAPWHDPHACYTSQATSLRLALECATTDAVKRTCPQCNLSFVKSEGCNKLVCLCGYSMCYVCREGLAVQGYKHFCQHFRERPGERCTECDKCDLYRVEDEERVVAKAREKAEKDWWASQGEQADGKVREGVNRDLKGWESAGKGGIRQGWKNWDVWLERVVEAVVA